MIGHATQHSNFALPHWLPDAAQRYLAHTAGGRPIRDIAREAGCHASTVLRQVRRFETLRDDPLIDTALTALSEQETDISGMMKDAIDVLRCLAAEGCLMIYNTEVQNPAIVRAKDGGLADLVRAVPLALAGLLVMRDWVAQKGNGTVLRYRITDEGRSALPALVAARDQQAADPNADDYAFSDVMPDRRSRNRATQNGPGSESPLVVLARRRSSDGQPFLSRDFVVAGERLREDYELSGLSARSIVGWTRPDALDAVEAKAQGAGSERQARAIRAIVTALRDLGPGLSDVVVQCCCLREGLEVTEKRMGWSARSGKIVLRIALQRLVLHYDQDGCETAHMIG